MDKNNQLLDSTALARRSFNSNTSESEAQAVACLEDHSDRTNSSTSQQIDDLWQLTVSRRSTGTANSDNDNSQSSSPSRSCSFVSAHCQSPPRLKTYEAMETTKHEITMHLTPPASPDHGSVERHAAISKQRADQPLIGPCHSLAKGRNRNVLPITKQPSKSQAGATIMPSQANGTESFGDSASTTSTMMTQSLSSCNSIIYMIPPPPSASLRRMSSTPGAFMAGGCESSSQFHNPDDEPSLCGQEPTRANSMAENGELETFPASSEVLVHARLVTDGGDDDDNTPVPLVTAKPVNEKDSPWYQQSGYRLCIGSAIVIVMILAITLSTVELKGRDSDNDNNSTQTPWDLDTRFRTAKKQAFYVVVFGSATSCADLQTPELS